MEPGKQKMKFFLNYLASDLILEKEARNFFVHGYRALQEAKKLRQQHLLRMEEISNQMNEKNIGNDLILLRDLSLNDLRDLGLEKHWSWHLLLNSQSFLTTLINVTYIGVYGFFVSAKTEWLLMNKALIFWVPAQVPVFCFIAILEIISWGLLFYNFLLQSFAKNRRESLEKLRITKKEMIWQSVKTFVIAGSVVIGVLLIRKLVPMIFSTINPYAFLFIAVSLVVRSLYFTWNVFVSYRSAVKSGNKQQVASCIEEGKENLFDLGVVLINCAVVISLFVIGVNGIGLSLFALLGIGVAVYGIVSAINKAYKRKKRLHQLKETMTIKQELDLSVVRNKEKVLNWMEKRLLTRKRNESFLYSTCAGMNFDEPIETTIKLRDRKERVKKTPTEIAIEVMSKIESNQYHREYLKLSDALRSSGFWWNLSARADIRLVRVEERILEVESTRKRLELFLSAIRRLRVGSRLFILSYLYQERTRRKFERKKIQLILTQAFHEYQIKDLYYIYKVVKIAAVKEESSEKRRERDFIGVIENKSSRCSEIHLAESKSYGGRKKEGGNFIKMLNFVVENRGDPKLLIEIVTTERSLVFKIVFTMMIVARVSNLCCYFEFLERDLNLHKDFVNYMLRTQQGINLDPRFFKRKDKAKDKKYDSGLFLQEDSHHYHSEGKIAL